MNINDQSSDPQLMMMMMRRRPAPLTTNASAAWRGVPADPLAKCACGVVGVGTILSLTGGGIHAYEGRDGRGGRKRETGTHHVVYVRARGDNNNIAQ